MLKMEIIRFEAQDVITASCICSYSAGSLCPQNDHYGCPADAAHGHNCQRQED